MQNSYLLLAIFIRFPPCPLHLIHVAQIARWPQTVYTQTTGTVEVQTKYT